MKIMKQIMALMLAVAMAAGLVGCGEIPYEDILGDWTSKTINDQSLEEYAAMVGVTPADAAVNMSFTDDNKLAVTNATASQNYVYERKSDGVEVKEEGKDDILFSMKYDDGAKTLTYQMDLGNGQMMTIVMEKGTTDFSKDSSGKGNKKK